MDGRSISNLISQLQIPGTTFLGLRTARRNASIKNCGTCAIYNTDGNHGRGAHWIVLYKAMNGRIFLLDSLSGVVKYKQLTFWEEGNIVKPFFPYQSNYDSSCGLFAVAFVHLIHTKANCIENDLTIQWFENALGLLENSFKHNRKKIIDYLNAQIKAIKLWNSLKKPLDIKQEMTKVKFSKEWESNQNTWSINRQDLFHTPPLDWNSIMKIGTKSMEDQSPAAKFFSSKKDFERIRKGFVRNVIRNVRNQNPYKRELLEDRLTNRTGQLNL